MSPVKPCLEPGCPRLSEQGPRCPEHTAQYELARSRARPSWSPSRNRSAQRRFREAVLKRAGNQCQALLANGTRCPIKAPLFAHHTKSHNAPDGYDPKHGVCLCRFHHREVDSHAR